MTLDEATDLARQQAQECGVEMVIVRDDLSEDAGGYECCAAMYVSTLAIAAARNYEFRLRACGQPLFRGRPLCPRDRVPDHDG